MKIGSLLASLASAWFGVLVGCVVANDPTVGEHIPKKIESVGSHELADERKPEPNLEKRTHPSDEDTDVTVSIIVVDPHDQELHSPPATNSKACACSCLCPYDLFSIPVESPSPPTQQQVVPYESPFQRLPTTLVSSVRPTPPVAGPPVNSESAIVPLDDVVSPLPTPTEPVESSNGPIETPNVPEVPPTSSDSPEETPGTTISAAIPPAESDDLKSDAIPTVASGTPTPPTASEEAAAPSTAASPTPSEEPAAPSTTTSPTTSEEPAAPSTTTSPPSPATETEEPSLDPGTMELHSVLTLKLGG